MYGMAEPLVPSSSSNLSKGWTFRAICLQNPELTLETCAPELINAITFCLSTMMGASLDCPTRWAIGSEFKNWMAWFTSYGLVHWAIFILANLGLGLVWDCGGLLLPQVAVTSGEVSHIPSVPLWLA